MTSSKSTKRALISSTLAILMCVAMLIGTTFAWFTDSASTGVNKIVSGNLKVDIIGANSDSHIEKLDFTKATGAEGENLLWEPGCRYLTEGFRIANNGNLALKWKAEINKDNITDGKVEGSTIAKDGKSLLDVIDFYVVTSTDENADAVAIENFTGNLAKGAKSGVYYIKGVMKTTAGNDYQDLTLDGITITVYATQDTVESDSYDNQYDKYAQYGERTVKNEAPVVGTNGTYGLVDSGRDNINTKNVTYSIPAGNYDGGFYTQHFGINSTFDGNGSTFKSFQLNCGYVPTTEASTLVVSNLNVNGDLIITASSNNVVIYNCTAKHISVLGVKNDITVTIDGCKITGTPIANVVGNNKYGVYITRPVAEGTAKVSIINSELSNIKGHAIAVNSSGATCDFTITGNKFTNYGLDGEANRAAFKIWGDGVLAPTSNVGGNLNEQATVLANAIKANNTFNTGNNCVVAEFYGATLGLN